MKYINKILIFIIAFFCLSCNVSAEDNLVNIYLFHSSGCPHCKAEIKLLDSLKKEYDNIRVYSYEIHETDNSRIFKEVVDLLGVRTMGTPFTVIGTKTFNGYSEEDSKKKIMATIEYYSKYGYKDVVGEHLNITELPTYSVNDSDISVDEYIKDYGNFTIDLPIVGKINTKNLTLPIVTILIGLLDGFNPCAMWVLLFLISILIGMKDKRRMWTLGITFLVASTLTYLCFMLAWLNVANFLTSIALFRLLIALVALVGGTVNLIGYFKHKADTGCTVTSNKKRNKIFNKIKDFTGEKKLYVALLGVITLAVSVNIIELACSAGLPIVFIEILSVNNLNMFEQGVYIALYILCFFLDDLIVFIIAMTSLKLTGISTKYGKITKLVGGILLILIGILMIFKPEWLMFNF